MKTPLERRLPDIRKRGSKKMFIAVAPLSQTQKSSCDKAQLKSVTKRTPKIGAAVNSDTDG